MARKRHKVGAKKARKHEAKGMLERLAAHKGKRKASRKGHRKAHRKAKR